MEMIIDQSKDQRTSIYKGSFFPISISEEDIDYPKVRIIIESDFQWHPFVNKILTSTSSLFDYELQLLYNVNTTSLYADIKYHDVGAKEQIKQNDMEIESLKREINKNFRGLNQVIAVYLYLHKDHVEINTILNTRRSNVRRKVFSYQLKIHDCFPEYLLDFNVIFSKEKIKKELLPSDAIICFSR